MRLSKINVTKLFGVFDHEVTLDPNSRVRLIHGPNGFGKTVMLRMIAALAEGTTSIFEHTPFEEFCLTFEDGSAAMVRRGLGESKDQKSPPPLTFLSRNSEGQLIEQPPSTPKKVPRHLLLTVDQSVPGPYRLAGDAWVDGDGGSYSLSQIVEMFPYLASMVPPQYQSSRVIAFAGDLRVFFVETNRLNAEEGSRPSPPDRFYSMPHRYLPDESTVRPRVRQYSDDVVQRIGTVLASYAKRSQESDRTFPERLVGFIRDNSPAMTASQILGQMLELENKRRRLISLGLLDSESGLRDLSEEDVRRAAEALTIYVGDVKEKLNVFDDIADRIGSLLDIVNDRFRYKKLGVDRGNGFRVFGKDGQAIQLNDLSSGEQHEIIVLYELLFRAPTEGLILVDEPEISLHVAWQSRFLSDLLGILELTNAYAIVATHSPAIIGTRWDLTEELRGPDGSDPEDQG